MALSIPLENGPFYQCYTKKIKRSVERLNELEKKAKRLFIEYARNTAKRIDLTQQITQTLEAYDHEFLQLKRVIINENLAETAKVDEVKLTVAMTHPSMPLLESASMMQALETNPSSMNDHLIDVTQLIAINHQYPDKSDTFIEFIKSHLSYFKQLISTPEELSLLIKSLPSKSADELMQFILDSAPHCSHVIPDCNRLINLLLELPQYSSNMINHAMKDSIEFVDLFRHVFDLINLFSALEELEISDYHDAILDVISQDDDCIQRVMATSDDLVEVTMSSIDLNLAGRLGQLLLKNPETFKRIFPTQELLYSIRNLLSSTHPFAHDVIKLFAEHDHYFTHVFTQNPSEQERWIYLSKTFGENTEQVVALFLQSADRFNSICPNSTLLNQVLKACVNSRNDVMNFLLANPAYTEATYTNYQYRGTDSIPIVASILAAPEQAHQLMTCILRVPGLLSRVFKVNRGNDWLEAIDLLRKTLGVRPASTIAYRLLNEIIRDPASINSYITQENLDKLSIDYPEYAVIFNQPTSTLSDIKQACSEYAMMDMASEVLVQSLSNYNANNPDCKFFDYPSDGGLHRLIVSKVSPDNPVLNPGDRNKMVNTLFAKYGRHPTQETTEPVENEAAVNVTSR